MEAQRRALALAFLVLCAVTLLGLASLAAHPPWRGLALGAALALVWVLFAALGRSWLALAQSTLEDPLTGLYNRRYLAVRLEEEVERVRRYGGQVSLAIIDLDDFKQVNDRHGHPEGDRLLRRVGQLLRGSLRSLDLVFRYGGEEFLVLFPETDLAQAVHTLRRMGQAILREGIRLSAGVASLRPGQTADDLLREADRALLLAKVRGKGQIAVAASGDVIPWEARSG